MELTSVRNPPTWPIICGRGLGYRPFQNYTAKDQPLKPFIAAIIDSVGGAVIFDQSVRSLPNDSNQ